MNLSFKAIARLMIATMFFVTSSVSALTSQDTEAGKISDAMKLYTQATPMEAQSSERAELLNQAESILLEVIKSNPNSLDAHRKLMGVYLQKRDYRKAIQTMQNAITLSPEDPKLYVALAILYEHSGSLEYADAILTEALAIDPNLKLAQDYKVSIQQKIEMQNIAMESNPAPHETGKPHSMEKRLSE